MGIKGLPVLIKKVAGTAIKTNDFSDFKGYTVSVDASLLISQTVYAIRIQGYDMTNSAGEITSHLNGIFYKTLTFLENEMIPIYVFDGKACSLKSKTIEKRKAIKQKAKQFIEKCTDTSTPEYKKNYQRAFQLTDQHIVEAKILLDLMGIPYISAPGEADDVCSWLASRRDENGKRYVKGVCSEDSDMLPLGAPYLFKGMLKHMNRNKPIETISLSKTLRKMNITMPQFVDLCVMLGTDNCDKFKGYGAESCLKLVKKYGSLENIIETQHKSSLKTSGSKTSKTSKSGSKTSRIKKSKKSKPKKIELSDSDSDNSDESDNSDSSKKIKYNHHEKCMLLARDHFNNALTDLDNDDSFVISDDNLNLRKYQFEPLMDFMCCKHGFDIERINTGVKRLDKYYKNMGITKENKKKVHKVSNKNGYSFDMYDKLDFISSSEENDTDSENSESECKEKSKKSCKNKYSKP